MSYAQPPGRREGRRPRTMTGSINRQKVILALYVAGPDGDDGPVRRATNRDLCRLSGLGISAVQNQVNRLIDDGDIVVFHGGKGVPGELHRRFVLMDHPEAEAAVRRLKRLEAQLYDRCSY